MQDRVLVKVTGVYHNNIEGFPPYCVDLSDDTGLAQPIYVGEFEAYAIAYALAGQPMERPLTHDLLITCLAEAGAVIAEVWITEVKGETYHALLTFRISDQVHEVDARPSDAVAIALRVKCPIFVSKAIFQVFRPYPPQSPATKSPLDTNL